MNSIIFPKIYYFLINQKCFKIEFLFIDVVLYDDQSIGSISDLLHHLKIHKQTSKGPIWYRGHAQKNWDLLPSQFRPENKKEEHEYLKQFKKDALLLVEPIPKSQYEWLFIMRHNHLPTRLLDWTENPLTALYFALFDKLRPGVSEEDSVLWALLPLELNKNFTELENEQSLPSFEEDMNVLSPYTPEKYGNPGEKGKQKPMAFLAPRNTKRMQAQQSVFTIHHRIKDPIDQIGNSKHVWKYIIPKEKKNEIRTELRLLGINKFLVYPELPVIHEKIKEEEEFD